MDLIEEYFNTLETPQVYEFESYAYNGESVCPSVIVKQGEKELEYEDPTKDYSEDLEIMLLQCFDEYKNAKLTVSVDNESFFSSAKTSSLYSAIAASTNLSNSS